MLKEIQDMWFMEQKFTDREISGDPDRGLVIFCGGLRFWGIPYGRRSVPAGLRRGNYAGLFIYWPWHEKWTGVFPNPSLPALWDVKLHSKHAAEIATFIEKYREKYPGRAVHLMACSAGGAVVVRVMEELAKKGLKVDTVGLLSVAVWPGLDLTEIAHKTVAGKIVNFCSALDCLILGLGTLLFGTGDRRHSCAAGMLGLRRTHSGKVENSWWNPRMMRIGRYGGHNSAINSKFVAEHVVPMLEI